MTLRGNVLITIIAVYGPPSERSRNEKDEFYDKLTEVYRKDVNVGPVVIAGDFNARVQQRLTEDATGSGNWTCDKQNNINIFDATDQVQKTGPDSRVFSGTGTNSS